jgi:hypothetical protein
MRQAFSSRNLGRVLAILASVTVAVAATATGAVAVTPPSVTATSLPIVQGLDSPLGDISLTEASVGQLTAGDVITFRFLDSAAGSTIHFNTTASVGGSQGLSATAQIASSSGTLNDEVVVTINTASSGNFPGTLTLTGLNASIDPGAANGNDIVRVSDASSIIASSGSPITVSDANAIGTSAKSVYSALSKPVLTSTGYSQAAGDLTITEPAKLFFHTGDVITFTIRDALGSADTVGLAGTPTVSGGGMLVSAGGLSGGSVQPNDTGFKVTITQQDPSNGSASTLQVSNLVYNTGQAPVGPVYVTATVTTGSLASTEYIFPGRVENAVVGGNTTITSAGNPVLTLNATGEPAANLTIIESPGALKAGTTFSLAIQEAGVTFSTSPVASVTSGDTQLSVSTASLDSGKVTATWTVSTTSTVTSTIVIGPVSYDVASSGPAPGDFVNLLASGGTGSGFTSQTLSNAQIEPSGATLFTATGAPSTPGSAADVTYTEVSGQQAPTGGSIVLLSPYATQIAAYRTTFAAVPTAAVTGGTGLVLGAGSVNSSPMTVMTANGPITAPAQTAAIFPVTTGSTTASTVTFSGISYALGSLVAPGALVGTGVADSGAAGAGSAVAGNDYSNAVNPIGLGGGGGTPIYTPDAQIKLSTSSSFLGNNVYNTTGTGQTVSGKALPGKKVTFVIAVQNDGNTSDMFTVKGTGTQKPLVAKYLQGLAGTTSITTQVVAGTYTTLTVGPTGMAEFRLIVTVPKTTKVGTTKTWTVLATSVGDPTKKDAVKAKIKVT